MSVEVQESVRVGDDFVQFFIKLQSLCRMLTDYQIREDFKTGKVVPVGNPVTILSSIDVISGIVFPSWDVLMTGQRVAIETSELHLRLLWQRSSVNFEIQSETHELELFSYNAWIEAFEELFISSYWLEPKEAEMGPKLYDEEMVSWQDEDAECTEITTDRIVQTNNLDFDQQETNFSESKLSTAVSFEPRHNTNYGYKISESRRSQNKSSSEIQEDIIVPNKKCNARNYEHKPKAHQCPQCAYSSEKEPVLRQHIDNVHKGLKPHKCPHCDYAAAMLRTLRIHINTIHLNIKAYKCEQCPRSFGHTNSLKLHVDGVHKKVKPYKCSQCDFACVQKQQLNAHITQIHNKEHCYRCKHCSYESAYLSSMRTHVSGVHKKEKNFKCQDCSYAANTKQGLSSHMQRIHNAEIKCRRCDYSTFSKEFFYHHMEKMHKVLYNLACEYEGCDHITSTNYYLQNHIKSIHLGIKAKKKKPLKKARIDTDVQQRVVENLQFQGSDKFQIE